MKNIQFYILYYVTLRVKHAIKTTLNSRSSGKDSAQGAQLWSLAGELRSACNMMQAKKKKIGILSAISCDHCEN